MSDLFEAAGVDVDETTCKHCERPIVHYKHPGAEWVHKDDTTIGCDTAERKGDVFYISRVLSGREQRIATPA